MCSAVYDTAVYTTFTGCDELEQTFLLLIDGWKVRLNVEPAFNQQVLVTAVGVEERPTHPEWAVGPEGERMANKRGTAAVRGPGYRFVERRRYSLCNGKEDTAVQAVFLDLYNVLHTYCCTAT